MASVTYKEGNDLDLDQVIELYRASTLGERRPMHNRDVMKGMIENADIILTAWEGSNLVGISRTLTDFWNVAYLADLAVHLDYQRKGIGKELIAKTRDALQPTCSIVLLSAPKANDYYPKVGFESNPRAWTLGPKTEP
jgi:ribosomal protein S18 acetylase RimI-like enzyme